MRGIKPGSRKVSAAPSRFDSQGPFAVDNLIRLIRTLPRKITGSESGSGALRRPRKGTPSPRKSDSSCRRNQELRVSQQSCVTGNQRISRVTL
jgi:hypothetical protein